MKVLLDIEDSRALHLLGVLKGLSYVKTTTLSEEKAELISEVREAVEELKLIKAGKSEARDAEEFLDEL